MCIQFTIEHKELSLDFTDTDQIHTRRTQLTRDNNISLLLYIILSVQFICHNTNTTSKSLTLFKHKSPYWTKHVDVDAVFICYVFIHILQYCSDLH